MIIRKSQIITLNVLYYRPDYQNIIQEFILSYDDHVPELVRTHRFLLHWKRNIDAVVKEVLLGINGDRPERLKVADYMFNLD